MIYDINVDPPGEPKDVEIAKYDRSSVTLKWKEPTDDGGDPIEGEEVYLLCWLSVVYNCLEYCSIDPIKGYLVKEIYLSNSK